MKCAWELYLKILPSWMRDSVDMQGKEKLQEVRMRVGQPPELILGDHSIVLSRTVKREDIDYIVNVASAYSPWAAGSLSKGYITAHGGHRIGICGDAVVKDKQLTGFRYVTSLCIRVCRDFPGVSKDVPLDSGSTLIIGSPCCGKTTLLRDMIRQYSVRCGKSISVVDERGEIFPSVNGEFCFHAGCRVDILNNCSKHTGIEMLLRAMSPGCIALDEITKQEDAEALLDSMYFGVTIMATAHASGKKDLFARPIYRQLIDSGMFRTLIIMQQDKSWRLERI